jgi:hypothetical protein
MRSGPGDTGHICALRSLARCAIARGPLYLGLGKAGGPAGALQLRDMAMHGVPQTASALRRSVTLPLVLSLQVSRHGRRRDYAATHLEFLNMQKTEYDFYMPRCSNILF